MLDNEPEEDVDTAEPLIRLRRRWLLLNFVAAAVDMMIQRKKIVKRKGTSLTRKKFSFLFLFFVISFLLKTRKFVSLWIASRWFSYN